MIGGSPQKHVRSPLVRAALFFWGPLALLGALLYWALMVLYFGLPDYLTTDSNDLLIYRATGESVLRGDLPYKDFFIEYPPGSLPAFVPPALLSASPESYITLFASEMSLVLVGALILTALAGRKLGGLSAWAIPALAFATSALVLHPVAVTRYDAVVTLALAAAVLGAAIGGRYLLLSYASLGVGAAAKLVPALAVLPLALLRREGDGPTEARRRALLGGLVFSVALGLFFAPAYLLGGRGFFESFAYHADRGVQIESLSASVLMKLGWVTGVAFDYGAIEVRGRGVELASSLSLPITGVLLLVTVAAVLWQYRRGRLSPGDFPRYAAALILAFMIGSKVLSPQYMLWLLPLVPVAAGGFAGVGISAVFLAACWTTSRVFPDNYPALTNLQTPAIDLLLSRNLLLVLLWALLLFLPPRSPKEPS